MQMIQNRLNEELKGPDLCRNRLAEIIKLSQLAGFNSIAETALARYESAGNACSRISREYETENAVVYMKIKVAVNAGNMKIANRYSADSKEYYFVDGNLEWDIYDKTNDFCNIV